MKTVWWSSSSYHTYFLTSGWGLVIIEFLPHPFPLVIIEFLPHLFPHDHERVRSGDHLPHLFPHKRVRSGDHWVLTTPISSRSQEGEVWWSLSSYHILFLTRGWGLYMKLVFICTMWNDLCTPYLPLEYGIWSSPPWGYSQGNCHWPR